MSRPLRARTTFAVSYHGAESAWFRGDYRETLALLDAASPRGKAELADAALLRARAEQRAGRHQESLEAARSAGSVLDGDRLATSLMLQGAALTRLGALADARAVLARAAQVAVVHRTIAAEILLQQAFLAWVERDLAQSRALAVKAIGRADDIVLARAQELLGFINTSEEKYGDAARSFRQALATLASAKHQDQRLRLNLVNAATSLAIERLDTDALGETRAALDSIAWTDDLAEGRFHAYDMAGWLALLAGQTEAAWRAFTTANASAGDGSPCRVIGLTNLAALYRTTNELFAARQHIGLASELARSIDWESTNGDERAAFLLWAIESARLNLPIPLEEFRAFERLPPAQAHYAFEKDDRRFRAMRLVAHGLTLGHTRRDRAIKLLAEALAIWLAIGYRFRAAQTALDLYRLAGNSEYLEIAQRETRQLRKGFMAATIRANRRREERGISQLSSTERRILAGILEGKSAAQIAAANDKALQTVKNQTRSIFRALNVRSRGELFVTCAELGVDAATLENEP
ncbi:MAG: helix-turn-helix transcriptional regulator [Candidatus Velthaea sp.]